MYNIIIADDELLARMVLKQTLEESFGERCVVRAASNGREALEAAATVKADIAILDIEMPGMSGLEAARRILDRLPHCKIVMLTAYSEFEYAREALALGLADYLLKPCSDNELRRVMKKLFAQIDSQREGEAERERLIQRIESLSRRLEAELARTLGPEGTSSEGDDHLNRIRREIEQFVNEHYYEDIFLPEMARAMNYSIAHFSRLFKQIFQRNFIVYLTEVRIRAAKEFLRGGDMTIREIGERVGYKEPNYFTKVFRKAVGQSPSEYRENSGGAEI